MRSAPEIVAYIEQRVGYMLLDRPHMYASSPEALEEVLYHLDEVRRCACSAKWEFGISTQEGYVAFTQSAGCGSASFIGRHRLDRGPDLDDRELFTRLVEFWKEYLRSDYSRFE